MIALFSPQRQNEAMLDQIQQKVLEVVRSGEYVLGREVDAFEQSLGKRLGFPYSVGCSSGTDALILALKALALEPGDEVITPAFSFVASANVIPWCGLKPVFADVSPETAVVTVESVQQKITPKTRAIIAVDLYGRQAPIRELRKLCDQYGLYLIEDGAQSIGVPVAGAHFYTTSFYPTKNLGALGDGGAVLTGDGELATRVREMTRHGSLIRDHYTRIGTTARLDTIQAAILNLKLEHLEAWTAQRRMIAAWYLRHLKPYQESGLLTLPVEPAHESQHVWALFTLRIAKGRRPALVENLRAKGVGCGVYYPKAIHQQPSLEQYRSAACPGAEKLADEVLSLPLYPELSAKEFEFVVKSLVECLHKNST